MFRASARRPIGIFLHCYMMRLCQGKPLCVRVKIQCITFPRQSRAAAPRAARKAAVCSNPLKTGARQAFSSAYRGGRLSLTGFGPVCYNISKESDIPMQERNGRHDARFALDHGKDPPGRGTFFCRQTCFYLTFPFAVYKLI